MKFLLKGGTKGLEFCFASSQLHGRHEVVPLIPLYIPQSLNTLKVHEIGLSCRIRFVLKKF